MPIFTESAKKLTQRAFERWSVLTQLCYNQLGKNCETLFCELIRSFLLVNGCIKHIIHDKSYMIV